MDLKLGDNLMKNDTNDNNARTLLARYNTVRLVGTVDAVGICESGKTLCLKDIKLYSLDGIYSHDICVGEIDHMWLHGIAINKSNIQNGIATVIGHTGIYHKRSGIIQFGIKAVCIYKGSEYKPLITNKSKSKTKRHG